jgi:hypothetical protein
VISVGERAFTVYVPLFGYEGTIYVDRLHGAGSNSSGGCSKGGKGGKGGRAGKGGGGGGGVKGNLNDGTGVLSLQPPAASSSAASSSAGAWPPLGVVTDISVFTLLTVRLTAKACVPIDVQIDITGESERNVVGGVAGNAGAGLE